MQLRVVKMVFRMEMSGELIVEEAVKTIVLPAMMGSKTGMRQELTVEVPVVESVILVIRNSSSDWKFFKGGSSDSWI